MLKQQPDKYQSGYLPPIALVIQKSPTEFVLTDPKGDNTIVLSRERTYYFYEIIKDQTTAQSLYGKF